MNMTHRSAVGAAIAATLAYCWLVWWLAGWFEMLIRGPLGALETRMLSVVLVGPLPGTFLFKAVHWQAVALVSLIVAVRAMRPNGERGMPPSSVSLVAHAFLLVFLVCLHVIGFIASFAAIPGAID